MCTYVAHGNIFRPLIGIDQEKVGKIPNNLGCHCV